MSYQRLLDKVEGSTSGGAEGLDDRFRPLFGKEVRRRDQLEPLAELNAWIEKSVRLDPHTEDAKVLVPQLADQVAAAEQERDAGVRAISTLAKPHTSAFKEFGPPQVSRTDNGVPLASAHARYALSKTGLCWLRMGIRIELEDLTYPFHDRSATVTRCGRICFNRRKINLSQVFAGQNVGVTQIGERIWLSPSWTTTWDISTTRHVASNRSTIPSVRKCYLCPRNELLPMCPEWTGRRKR